MMRCDEKLMRIVEWEELDMGFISVYQKENETLKLKMHISFFKINDHLVFNNKFRIPNEYLDNSRIYMGKKGVGIVFSETFQSSMAVPGSIRYCYEMRKGEIEVLKQYSEGNY